MTDTDTQADRFEQMMRQAVDKLFEQHDGKLESMDGREQELVLIWRAEATSATAAYCNLSATGVFPPPKRLVPF